VDRAGGNGSGGEEWRDGGRDEEEVEEVYTL